MENQIEQKMESEVTAGVGMISNIVGPFFFVCSHGIGTSN